LSDSILDRLEKLIEESAKKRMSFLMALTKSSRSISAGADEWFRSEVELLTKEMEILESIMAEDVEQWRKRVNVISARFKKAISYLNDIIDRAERGGITSVREIQPPKKETLLPSLAPVVEEVEEEKELNLVSAILEVFDSASDLEKLINEVEKEGRRTVRTAKLVVRALQKK
jgi:hypothetical protein